MVSKDGSQPDSGADTEIRRLRAESAALQKSLTSKCLLVMHRQRSVISSVVDMTMYYIPHFLYRVHIHMRFTLFQCKGELNIHLYVVRT